VLGRSKRVKGGDLEGSKWDTPIGGRETEVPAMCKYLTEGLGRRRGGGGWETLFSKVVKGEDSGEGEGRGREALILCVFMLRRGGRERRRLGGGIEKVLIISVAHRRGLGKPVYKGGGS